MFRYTSNLSFSVSPCLCQFISFSMYPALLHLPSSYQVNVQCSMPQWVSDPYIFLFILLSMSIFLLLRVSCSLCLISSLLPLVKTMFLTSVSHLPMSYGHYVKYFRLPPSLCDLSYFFFSHFFFIIIV